jgi:predicted dehydrogenase
VHENFRWQKPFVTLKRLIDEGRIGRPEFARLSFRHGFDVYANQPYLAEVPRLALMDVGLHLYDVARFLTGEAAHLTCTTQRRNPKVAGEDAFTTLLAQESGATVICDASFYSRIEPEPFPNTVAWIEGEAGTLALDAGGRVTVHGPAREVINAESPVPAWGERPWHVVQDSVARFEAHAAEVFRGKANGQPSGADNLKTLALALASYESAASHSTIDMRRWREAG